MSIKIVTLIMQRDIHIWPPENMKNAAMLVGKGNHLRPVYLRHSLLQPTFNAVQSLRGNLV